MRSGARPDLARPWRWLSCRAPQSLRLWLAAVAAGGVLSFGPLLGASPAPITGAKFGEPTTRYDHGILGDAVEWGALILTLDRALSCDGECFETVTIRLPETRVFEDLAPRIILDGEGEPLVMVVESDLKLGARLALYDQDGLHAATPFIGRSRRWLAPIGAGDLDGDGHIEVAYIDRPHLAKTLKIWRLGPEGLTFVAKLSGLTNHRIGWDFIPGGLRQCGQGGEMIVASGDWARVVAVRLQAGVLVARDVEAYENPRSLERNLACVP